MFQQENVPVYTYILFTNLLLLTNMNELKFEVEREVHDYFEELQFLKLKILAKLYGNIN